MEPSELKLSLENALSYYNMSGDENEALSSIEKYHPLLEEATKYRDEGFWSEYELDNLEESFEAFDTLKDSLEINGHFQKLDNILSKNEMIEAQNTLEEFLESQNFPDSMPLENQVNIVEMTYGRKSLIGQAMTKKVEEAKASIETNEEEFIEQNTNRNFHSVDQDSNVADIDLEIANRRAIIYMLEKLNAPENVMEYARIKEGEAKSSKQIRTQ